MYRQGSCLLPSQFYTSRIYTISILFVMFTTWYFDTQWPSYRRLNTIADESLVYLSMCSMRMPTALLWASSSSTFASCITAPPTFRSPSAVRLALVMCLMKDPRLTPEYCLAYP